MAESDEKAPERQLAIQKVYVKDFSFESPHTPQVFTKSDCLPAVEKMFRGK